MKMRREIGKSIRTVLPIGGSLCITLPKKYVETQGLRAGDKVELLCNQRIFIGKPLKNSDLEEEMDKLEKVVEK
jgi:antitoxin component of MazEF toxin-antitoxin module